jgi:hypothetical protein
MIQDEREMTWLAHPYIWWSSFTSGAHLLPQPPKSRKLHWWCLFRVPTSVLLSPNFIQSRSLYDFLHKFAQFSTPLTIHIKMNEPKLKYGIKCQHYKKNIMMFLLCSSRDVDLLCEEWPFDGPLGSWAKWPSLFDSIRHPCLILLPENNKTAYADKLI